MTETEFRSQMNRLVAVYSEKAYPPERMQIIWREMKNAAVYEFENIVSELIGSCSYAPMIDKFRAAKSDLFSKNHCDYERQLKSWVENQPKCPYCEKRGYIVATRRTDRTHHAFGCKCAISKRLYPKYLQWSNLEFLSEYEPQFKKISVPHAQSAPKIDPSSLLQEMPL